MLLAIFLLCAADPFTTAAAAPTPYERADRRSFSLGFGAGQMAPALDVNWGDGNVFLSGGLLLPLVSNGEMGSFALGGGPHWSVTQKQWLKLGFFFHLSPGWSTSRGGSTGYPRYEPTPGQTDPVFAIGAGFSLILTLPGGFSLGVRLPIFGYALAPQTIAQTTLGIAYYYLFAYTGVPSLTLGYRF
ncbi:MAG: hypothetical protein IT381_30480 [Deltaproteobacteria bacterium]|nr:hypothetical protein [Deltaproteobacteria bacterium]